MYPEPPISRTPDTYMGCFVVYKSMGLVPSTPAFCFLNNSAFCLKQAEEQQFLKLMSSNSFSKPLWTKRFSQRTKGDTLAYYEKRSGTVGMATLKTTNLLMEEFWAQGVKFDL